MPPSHPTTCLAMHTEPGPQLGPASGLQSVAQMPPEPASMTQAALLPHSDE